ncbi:MAG: phosphoribosylformylglycinamidine synthase subunit PurQ [Bdellovibrionota bacterium]
MKLGVVRFLGTNCDFDVFEAIKEVGLEPEWLWYQDQFQVNDYKALFLPGGFSYGDYLRCGALAARAPIMKSVREAAKKGTPILGICNGFQILCESGLLPGVLVQNSHLRFIDKWVDLNLKNASPFTSATDKKIRLPVAHGEGRYIVEEDEVRRLFDDEQVWLTYGKNPNGSVEDIAGVLSSGKNVAGLMPHPERAMTSWMGGQDGRSFFESLV